MSKLELINKIKALADRGIGGEKVNAAAMLAAMMQKYGVTSDDLDSTLLRRFELSYKGIDTKFAVQIVASEVDRIHKYNKSKTLIFDVTPERFLYIKAKLHFFWKAYNKEHKAFFVAFVMKNQLFTINTKKREEDLTEAEREMYRKAYLMKDSIDRYSMNKHLNP